MAYYDVYDIFNSDPETFVREIQGYVPYKIIGSTDAKLNLTTIFPEALEVYNADRDLTTITDDQYPTSVEDTISWQVVVLALVLCLVGLAGDVPSLVSLLRRKKSLTSHWYIFHIIISNFLLTFSLTFFLFEKLSRRNIHTSASICVARNSILYLSFFSSAFFLVFLSIDRFLSSSQTSTSFSKRFRSRVITYLVTGLTWLVSIILCIPIAIHTVSSLLAKAFLSYFSVIYVTATLVSCLFCWSAWKLAFNQNSHTLSKTTTTLSETENQNRVTWVPEEGACSERHRLTPISALMISFFFISWLFLFVFHLKENFKGVDTIFLSCEKSSPVTSIQIIAEFLVYANAAFTSYIYITYLVRKVRPSSRG